MRNRIVLFLLLAVVALAHGRTLTQGLAFDDHYRIHRDPLVRGEWIADASTWMLRPVTRLSLRFDRFWWSGPAGIEPFGFHLTNLLLHTLCGYAVYLLARRFGLRTLPALLGAILFLVHPVQTEAVALSTHRKEILAGLAAAAALLAYARGTVVGRLVAWPLWGLAVLAKEVAFPLPLLFLWAGGGPIRTRLRRAAPFLAVVFAGLVLVAVFETPPGYPARPEPSRFFADLTTGDRLAVVVRAQGIYLGRVLLPFGLHAEHARPGGGEGWDASATGILLLLLGAGAGGVLLLRRTGGGIGLAWYATHLLLTSNLVAAVAYPVAERYLYIPMAGLSILLAAVVGNLLRRGPGVGVALLAIGFLFCVRSSDRDADWRGDVPLHAETLRWNPRSAEANLGMALRAYHRTQAATPDPDPWRVRIDRVLSIRPDDPIAHTHVGLWWWTRGGDAERAARHFQRAVAGRVDLGDAWAGLAAIHLGQGRIEEAVEAAIRARRSEGSLARFPEIGGLVSRVRVRVADLERAGDFEGAYALSLQLARLDPDGYRDLDRAIDIALRSPGRRLVMQALFRLLDEAIRDPADAERRDWIVHRIADMARLGMSESGRSYREQVRETGIVDDAIRRRPEYRGLILDLERRVRALVTGTADE